MKMNRAELQNYINHLEDVIAHDAKTIAQMPPPSNPDYDWQRGLELYRWLNSLRVGPGKRGTPEHINEQLEISRETLRNYVGYLKRLTANSNDDTNLFELEQFTNWLQDPKSRLSHETPDEYKALISAVRSNDMYFNHNSIGAGFVAPIPPDVSYLTSPSRLRQWWHNILRISGNYSCYGIILALPSDTEVLNYLSKYMTELDILSGIECLVIAFTKVGFWFWERENHNVTNFSSAIIEDYTNQGHCVQIGKKLGIQLDEYPCFVLFDDIRSPHRFVVSLKSLDEKEIAQTLRYTFSTIQLASSKKVSPLLALEKEKKKGTSAQKKTLILNKAKAIVGETMQTALEAWINSSIK